MSITEIDQLETVESVEVLSQRAVRGSTLLLARKFVLRGISYIVSILLARLLAPEIFGLFAIINFIITFFQYFSDIGFGASLIQKKKISKKELDTVFTLQQLIVVSLIIIAWFTAPLIVNHHPKLDPSSIWLIRIMSLSLLFTSLKTIPQIKLERQLKFDRLIVPEVVEVLSFQAIALGLAWSGYGVWSFVIALVIRSFLGLATLYLLAPYRPRPSWHRPTLKHLIGFGLPYQSNYFLALIKDSLTPVFIGLISGSYAVGLLNWAFSVSKLPIEFISDIFRVTFPSFARIQGNRVLIKKAVEKTIYFSNLIIFPLITLLIVFAQPLVDLVYTVKWQPALPAFYVHAIAIFFVGINNVVTNSLWSLGKVKSGMKIMVINTILNWAISVPLVFKMGFIGVMYGSLAVMIIGTLVARYEMNRLVKLNLLDQTVKPLIAALSAGFIGFLLQQFFSVNFFTLILFGFLSAIVYCLMILIIDRKKVFSEANWILQKLNLNFRFPHV
jgi:PST family polysaccharide transporter